MTAITKFLLILLLTLFSHMGWALNSQTPVERVLNQPSQECTFETSKNKLSGIDILELDRINYTAKQHLGRQRSSNPLLDVKNEYDNL